MSKSKDFKKLKNEVIEFLNGKKRSLYLGTNKKLYVFLKYFMLIVCFRAIVALLLFREPNQETFFRLACQIVGSFFYFLSFHIISTEPPAKDRDKWLWKNGKRVYVLLPLAGLILLVPLFSYSEFNSINRIFAVICISFILLISSLIVFISNNPKYFLASFLTGFGTSLVIITPLTIPFLFVTKSLTIISTVIPLTVWTVCYFCSYIMYKRNLADKKFNLIQNSVLRFLLPKQILLALPSSILTALKAERKALQIEMKLEKNEEYEVEVYLLQRLKEKYPDKSSYTKGIITGIIIFIILGIISSLIEFITQDIIYIPYLQEFICKIFECKK